MKKILRRKRGITLMALVITIIILLILAGISIGLLSGDNGLFTKAKKAEINSKIAKIEEEANMINMSLDIEQYLDDSERNIMDIVKEELGKKRIYDRESSRRSRKDNRYKIK